MTPDDLVLGETPCETNQSVTVRSSISESNRKTSSIVAVIPVRTSESIVRVVQICILKIFDNVRPQYSSTSFNEQSHSVFPKDLAHFSRYRCILHCHCRPGPILQTSIVRRSQETIATDPTGKLCELSREKFTHPSGNLVSIKCKRQKW